MNRSLEKNRKSEWTTMFQKDPQIGREYMYYSLISRELFPEEQKSTSKKQEENNTDYTSIKTSPRTANWDEKNIARAQIHSKNAPDMILQSWIIYCFKMYKISDEVINFIENTMKNWRVELTAGGKSLSEVKIQRDIFRGNVISTLLFETTMMWLGYIFRKCTGGY